MPQQKVWYTTEELAEYTAIPAATFTTKRSRGEGPPYHKVGRLVRYHRDDIEAWLQGGRVAIEESAQAVNA